MIGAADAREAAAGYVREVTRRPDRMLEPWCAADVGTPLLVRTTDLDPSFWIVPVRAGDVVLGYVTVGLEGDPHGHAYLYERPDQLERCAKVVTRITADAARRLAVAHLADRSELTVGGPVFVHDGPANRLAWMMEAWDSERLVARLFATPGHVYERPVGEHATPPEYRGA